MVAPALYAGTITLMLMPSALEECISPPSIYALIMQIAKGDRVLAADRDEILRCLMVCCRSSSRNLVSLGACGALAIERVEWCQALYVHCRIELLRRATTESRNNDLMQLGMLSFIFRRRSVPIETQDMAVLSSDGARAFIYASSRGTERARTRIWSILAMLALLWLGREHLDWSGPDLLAILLAMTAISAVLDGLRLVLAGPWAVHSQSREYRADELLRLARAVERGQQQRLSLGPPPSKLEPAVAGAYTLAGVPLVWYALTLADWVPSALTGFGAYVLALIVALGLLRLGYELYRIRSVKLFPAGHFDLFLDAEDVVDNYLLITILIIAMVPLGSTLLLVVPFAVLLLRLIYQIYRYCSKWLCLRSLGRTLREM